MRNYSHLWALVIAAAAACSGNEMPSSLHPAGGSSGVGGTAAVSSSRGGSTAGGQPGVGGRPSGGSPILADASGGAEKGSAQGGGAQIGGASSNPNLGGWFNGGSSGKAGSTSGGRANGGTANGGEPSAGGSVTGGKPSGGSTSGNASSGGSSSGGKASGGANTGGVSMGGASMGGAAAIAWTNPIVLQRADPHVWLHADSYYYLAATVPEYNRIELRRASSLGGLTSAPAKTVWTRPASGAMAGPIWAPEIHPIDGKWYVYFSAGQGGQPWDSIRVFVMENASANPLEGTWTVKGQVTTKWDSFTLDATTFVHNDERYFVWAQVEPGRVGTNIMIAKMASPSSLIGEQVVLSRPTYTWETQGGVWVNEAPAAIVKNGKVFITYSASATDANYCMGLLTANADSNLLVASAWTKAAQPVFKSSDTTSQYGPGHNSFTTTPDGKTDILVYHSRNYKEIPGGNALGNPDRATRAQILAWKADGSPDFGIPVPDGRYTVPAQP